MTPEKMEKNLSGHSWQFPGGAESSYAHVVRNIQNDKRLSNKRKEELIEKVTYLVGHVLSDIDFMIRNDYGSAHSSGIKYLKFDTFKKPNKYVQYLFYDDLKSVYASSCLQALGKLGKLKGRVKKTHKWLFKDKENG